MLNERYLADLLVMHTDPLGIYVTESQHDSLDMNVVRFYLGPLYALVSVQVELGYMLMAVKND